MSSKTNPSVSFIWVYALLCAITLLGTLAIGCGDDKKKEKAGGTATGSKDGTATGDAKGKNPDGTQTQTQTTQTGENQQEESSGFFTAKDFPKGTQSLTSESVKSEITNTLTDIGIPTLGPEVKTDDLSCLTALANTKWTGDAKSLNFQFSKKLDCKKGSEFKKYDWEIELKIKYSCQKDAFASFVGKSLKETAKINLLKQCKSSKATYHFNSNLTTEYASKTDPKVAGESSNKIAYSTPKGTPCSITTTANSMEIAEDCQYFSLSANSGNDGKTAKTTLIGNFKDAKGPLDDKPLKSGSLVFSINNWKGSVTFDATLTPSFEASSGSKKVTGKIEETK